MELNISPRILSIQKGGHAPPTDLVGFKIVWIVIYSFKSSRDNFGKLDKAESANQVTHFFGLNGMVIFLLCQRNGNLMCQGTALWMPLNGKGVVFVYENGKLKEEPGFLISHKKNGSGKHYTKVSYVYGVSGERPFMRFERNQLDDEAFPVVCGRIFHTKTEGLINILFPP